MRTAKPWWSPSWVKLFLCAVLSVAILVACLGVVGGTTIIAMRESYQAQISGNPGNKDILVTSEYQISFPQPYAWHDREDLVTEWMEFWGNNSAYFAESQPRVSTTIRHQYFVDMTGRSSCHSGDRIRVREYEQQDSEGGRTTGTTVDIKGNSNSKSGALALPYWPDPALPSQQKMEQDYHGCSLKYSRESRVYLDTSAPHFSHCRDISSLFPWALKEEYDDHKVKVHKHEYWWVRQYSGYLDQDTRFAIAFTLRYPTREGARRQAVPANRGEWSIRIYSREDGLTDTYNGDVVQDTRDTWRQTAKHFGSGAC